MTDAADFDEIEAQLERGVLLASLRDFVVWAWPLIAGAPYVPNVISESIVATLQRVGDGELTRVLIACPPGVGKSTELACYSAWRRARNPGHRSIHGAHAFDLSSTESRRVRRFIEGDEYRRMFPEVMLRTDESTIGLWATTAGGVYIAVGVGGSLTGRRAMEAIVDDGLNAADRFSKASRDGLFVWFQEALSTRLDGDRAPIIVVGQRLDRDDLVGRLVEQGGWHLVELPAENADGSLNAPNVLPREKLDTVKRDIGAAAYATQFLQRPSDDSGAVVKRSWWRFHHPAHVASNTPRPSGCNTDVPAVRTPNVFSRVVVSADLTFGSTKGDYVCIQAWGAYGAARYLLAQWRRRAGLLESVAAIKAVLRDFPHAKVIIEKAANGAGAIEELAAAGVPNVVPVTPLGSKASRLSLVSATIEAGNALLPLGVPWLGDFVEELAGATKHDDQQDCAAYAIHELNAVDPELEDSRARILSFLSDLAPRENRRAWIEREISTSYAWIAPLRPGDPGYDDDDDETPAIVEASRSPAAQVHVVDVETLEALRLADEAAAAINAQLAGRRRRDELLDTTHPIAAAFLAHMLRRI